MLNKLKENLPTFEILLGYFMFLYFISETTISNAILCLMFFIYLWLFTSIYLNQYSFNSFLYIVCGSGMLVAVALFFLIGVEEVPYPQGALVFHSEGIAKAFFIFFICSIPLILTNKENKGLKTFNFHKTTAQRKEKSTDYDQDQWEEVSIEDIDPGEFETI